MGVAPCEIGKSLSFREFSSAGRASALQAEGQRFDPVNS
ncbi:putative conjugative element protein, partial [Streptococcus pneumoniae]